MGTVPRHRSTIRIPLPEDQAIRLAFLGEAQDEHAQTENERDEKEAGEDARTEATRAPDGSDGYHVGE